MVRALLSSRPSLDRRARTYSGAAPTAARGRKQTDAFAAAAAPTGRPAAMRWLIKTHGPPMPAGIIPQHSALVPPQEGTTAG
eukprot:SAG22_NODE_1987_length_3201_cov_12.979046_3_plen_82_part_00